MNHDLLAFVEKVAKGPRAATHQELIEEANALLKVHDCGECMGLGFHRSGDEGQLCVNCGGSGQEPLDRCESCGEPASDLLAVDDSDPSVGYYSQPVLCYECRRAPRVREAEAEGGLRPDAAILLGVDASWFYEGSTVPGKPVQRVLPSVPGLDEFAEMEFRRQG